MKSRETSAAAFILAITALAAVPAHAQQAQTEHQLSYNAAVTSEYRYRGLSQSRLDPALQGGLDYVHGPTGWYAGAWLSTIKWTKDLGGDGNIEWDVYGGKRGQLTEAVAYDAGALYYYYPSNHLNPNANTFELYGRLGYGPGYVKYSHATTNLFGTPDSKRSGYLDVGADIDLGSDLLLNLHVGRQRVRNNSALSYTDYKIGLSKDFGLATVALAYVNADTRAYLDPAGRNLGKSAAVLTVSKTF